MHVLTFAEGSILRTCAPVGVDDCKEINGVTYCYCKNELCNSPSDVLSSPAGHKAEVRYDNYDGDYPYDDYLYEEGSGNHTDDDDDSDDNDNDDDEEGITEATPPGLELEFGNSNRGQGLRRRQQDDFSFEDDGDATARDKADRGGTAAATSAKCSLIASVAAAAASLCVARRLGR